MRGQQEDTRKMVVLEMLEKEDSYINALDLLIKKFYRPLLDRTHGTGENFKRYEVEMIFKGLPNLLTCHKQVRDDLQRALDRWNPKTSCVGQLWIKAYENFNIHYPEHIRRQESVLLKLDDCEARSDFIDFVRTVESDPACGKHDLRSLLIRPVQHLPHIQLLLQKLLEKTPEQHPDHRAVQKARHRIASINKKANTAKKKMDEHFELWDYFDRIDQLPDNYYHADHRHLASVDLKVLEATGGVLKERCKRGRWVRLVLLDCKRIIHEEDKKIAQLDGRVLILKASADADITEIKRNQSVGPYGAGPSLAYSQHGVSRQPSTTSTKERKPWRFLAQHKFSDFLHFEVVRSKVADDDAYNLCLFRLQKFTPFEKAVSFFNQLIKQIIKERELETGSLWNDLELVELKEENLGWAVEADRRSDFEVITKALKKLPTCNYDTDSRVSRRSMLDRAFSNLSLGVSMGLRRLTTFGSAINLSRPALMSADDYYEGEDEEWKNDATMWRANTTRDSDKN